MNASRHHRQAPRTWNNAPSSPKEYRQGTVSPGRDHPITVAQEFRSTAQDDDWVQLANETLKLIRQLRI
ncbi:hypothetical protein B0684_06185 [Thioalkalivibrio versutus]|nr:hypothetical protein B0684_06185 [Thioalkalivibrio versutus]